MASCHALAAQQCYGSSVSVRRLLPRITSNSKFLAVEYHFSSVRLKSNSEKLGRGRAVSSMAETVTAPRGRGKVNVFKSEEELAVSLAKYTADLSAKVCAGRNSFTVVISGGSLVKSLRKLIEPPYIESVDWSKWHVFWVDERVVPKDHPDSNYLLASNEFLSKVPIPAGNIHSINDAVSAEGAADDYEACLKRLIEHKVIDQTAANGFPKFDLMLLGMGPDGHIASLFPGHPLLQENKKLVTSIKDSPKPPPERISFTLPVINSSAAVALIVAGASKSAAVHTALSSSSDPNALPVQLVAPQGELVWFLDNEAASKL
ncbi:probable 6-phosphogluconolactonase 4, chloroplastic [Andrographis paniculata]|uniref:probable 6-phosphogluconolactonase 4, chloroplastic n=1 Tax=Andrographis paniculata TaxID=175694 RepID=UPI0021E7EE26|nr:probable 6-phosphogluconolactonase 4, chloroplastic [Andrographis paniculata]